MNTYASFFEGCRFKNTVTSQWWTGILNLLKFFSAFKESRLTKRIFFSGEVCLKMFAQEQFNQVDSTEYSASADRLCLLQYFDRSVIDSFE